MPQLDPRMVGERLRTARLAAGLTQQQAVEESQMGRTTLVAIEKGERPVRPDELTRLAELYDVPIRTLLRSAGDPEPLVVRFRATNQTTDQDLASAVAMLQQLAEDYVELEELVHAPMLQLHPPVRSIGRLDPYQAGEELANAERNRLGLGDGPVHELDELLESSVGLRVFAPRLPSKVAGVYAYSEVLGGCIAVNGMHPFERQRWTLAHDYAHFLTDRDQPEATLIQWRSRPPRKEQFADAFAAAFLMPGPGLRQRINDIRRTGRGPTAADLLRMADQYRVSFQAMILRAEGLELLKRGTLDRLLGDGFGVAEGRRLLDMSTEHARVLHLPRRYTTLAVVAHDSLMITEEQLSRYLHVDRLEARQRVQHFKKRRILDDEGQVRWADIGDLLTREAR